MVEFYGKKFKHFKDYLRHIEKVLEFPRSCEGNIDRYLDWMRDLSWFDYDEYAFFIYDYSLFLQKCKTKERDFIDLFCDVILPFWDKDVENQVVDGKSKKMSVYLIN